MAEKMTIRELMSLKTPDEVHSEVLRICSYICPDEDFSRLTRIFHEIIGLFKGHYTGFRACNTPYHDLTHTMDCYIAAARLMHGALLNNIPFEKSDAELLLISALMHDTGYIQPDGDTVGTGAKYTLVHVQRSIDFMKMHLRQSGFTEFEIDICRRNIESTGYGVPIADSETSMNSDNITGQLLGTADLIGQMADRTYLEKLLYLSREFEEGGVPGFKGETDLLKNTQAFFENSKRRFEEEFGNVNIYMKDHFRIRCGVDSDPYHVAIDNHLQYLRSVFLINNQSYKSKFRRGGIVDKIYGKISGDKATDN